MIHTIACAVVQNLDACDIQFKTLALFISILPSHWLLLSTNQRRGCTDARLRHSLSSCHVLFRSVSVMCRLLLSKGRSLHLPRDSKNQGAKPIPIYHLLVRLGIPASSISFKTGHVYELEMTVPWSNSNTISQRNGHYSRYFVNSKYSSSTRVASLCITVRLRADYLT